MYIYIHIQRSTHERSPQKTMFLLHSCPLVLLSFWRRLLGLSRSKFHIFTFKQIIDESYRSRAVTYLRLTWGEVHDAISIPIFVNVFGLVFWYFLLFPGPGELWGVHGNRCFKFFAKKYANHETCFEDDLGELRTEN